MTPVTLERSSQDLPQQHTPKKPGYAFPLGQWTLQNGVPVTIRLIRPDDEERLKRFHERLSDQSVFHHYFHLESLEDRTAHERLEQHCQVDLRHQIALVAVRSVSAGESELVAVARLTHIPQTAQAEFALLVEDQFQHLGLGTELLQRLIQIARSRHWHTLTGALLPDNHAMERVCLKLGFDLRYTRGSGTLEAYLRVKNEDPSAEKHIQRH
jgi:acetyltransferase